MNSLFSLLFHHEYLAIGSGLAQGYLLLGELQEKWNGEKLEELNTDIYLEIQVTEE
jgi:hypothetical protein